MTTKKRKKKKKTFFLMYIPAAQGLTHSIHLDQKNVQSTKNHGCCSQDSYVWWILFLYKSAMTAPQRCQRKQLSRIQVHSYSQLQAKIFYLLQFLLSLLNIGYIRSRYRWIDDVMPIRYNIFSDDDMKAVLNIFFEHFLFSSCVFG